MTNCRRERTLLPRNFSPFIAPDDREFLQNQLNQQIPVHSLYTWEGARFSSAYIKKHFVSYPTERDTIIQLQGGLWVSCPEATFVQMATILSIPKLIELGFELCGRYSLAPLESDRPTQYDIEPLTTTESLRAFANATKKRHGTQNALTALQFVRDNSWSPMETKAAMLLGLPRSYGGKGLGLPSMNARVELNKDASVMTGKWKNYCDLMWERERVDVEYDSTLAHGSSFNLREDSLRRDGLKRMGIDVLTLTDVQMLDKQKFDAFARTLGKCLNKRTRPMTPELHEKELFLRNELLGG